MHGIPMDKTYFVIWTTTTWTLPANVAICLDRTFEYCLVKIGDEYHVMATELVKSVHGGGCHIERLRDRGRTCYRAEFELMSYDHVAPVHGPGISRHPGRPCHAGKRYRLRSHGTAATAWMTSMFAQQLPEHAHHCSGGRHGEMTEEAGRFAAG